MEMTVEQAVENHRKLWNGIVSELKTNGLHGRSASVIKSEVMQDLFPELKGKPVKHDCFLCEFVFRQDPYGLNSCKKCPLVDGEPHGCLGYRYAVFMAACVNDDIDQAIGYADEIAGLPVVNELYRESSPWQQTV